MSVSTVRERRRAETIREIQEAALGRLTEDGTGGLSLRGVARDVGMTVQALYHYFGSRDELLTALVTDAHDHLADAVLAAAERSRGRPRDERLHAVTGAYRGWAREHRAEFLLLYGTPVPGYRAPAGGPTVSAAKRLAEGFLETVFDGFTPEDLKAVAIVPGAEALADAGAPEVWSLPAGALALFLDFRARMHGVVMLEILDHLPPVAAHGDALFHGVVARMANELADLTIPRGD